DAASRRSVAMPPLSREPESFPLGDAPKVTPSVVPAQPERFPECPFQPARSCEPESFRGGCSFGGEARIAPRRALSRAAGRIPCGSRQTAEPWRRAFSESIGERADGVVFVNIGAAFTAGRERDDRFGHDFGGNRAIAAKRSDKQRVEQGRRRDRNALP